MLCSSPIDILLGVINGFVVFQLGWPRIVIKSWLQIVHENLVEHLYHYGIDFVFLHIIS